MPQQSRTILAVVLSMLTIFVYYTWINPPLPPTSQPINQNNKQAMDQSPTAIEKPQVKAGSPEALLKNTDVLPASGEQIVLENDSVNALFSSAGAVFSNFKLKDYHIGASDDTPSIDLLKDPSNAQSGSGLYLTTGLPEVDNQTNVFIGQKISDKEVVFTWQGQGLVVKKIVQLSGSADHVDPHWIDLSVEITNTSDQPKALDPRVWIKREQKKTVDAKGFFSFLKPPVDLVHPISFIDGQLNSDLMQSSCMKKEPPPHQQVKGKVYWAGLEDRYFLTTLISRQEGSDLSVNYGKLPNDQVYSSLSYGSLELKPGETTVKKYSAYFGPKKRDALQKIGFNLERSVDYGWLGLLAAPILWLLFFFYNLFSNWGVAILLLTFLIKLLLHPVNVKAMASMKAMQKIQPALTALKEKYKNDQQRLNTEMMELFKQNKVNPMGGCLPMILQMPIYMALYKVLYNAIELYHAPFFGPYKDLSAPDPYMILPIVLGIFMVLQQKLTPSPSVDPMQKQMMMIMPIMFMGIMLFLPAGLVLYILVNTVMSVIQQYMMHKDVTGIGLIKKMFKQ